jgi:2-methylcitrate dehydratase PrpD
MEPIKPVRFEQEFSRREFLDTAARYTLGGLTVSTIQAGSPVTTSAVQASSLIARLSEFIASTSYSAIPPKGIDTAKVAIMDCLGVALAGAREESARISSALVREERAKEETTVYGQRFKSSGAQAAFANGIAAHAHDFDHSFVLGGQPTSPIIPAVFAQGEALGASGKQVLEAYVYGFEIVSRLIFAVQGAGGNGWHANGTLGVFGSTAGCARLLALKDSEIQMALAMAASMASGVTSNFGTMTKPLHVGHAARNGVLAARMAKAGFTANPQTLEVRNGFFDSYYAGGKPDLNVFGDLGRTFAIEKYGVRFKPYPCGGLTHTAIYAAIQLRNEHRITPDLVEHVDVDVPRDTATTLTFRIPRAGLEGKFSMPYLIARALTDGNIMLETFTDEAVRSPQVLQLLEKIEMKVDPNLQSGSDGSRPAAVTIKLKNGQTHTLLQKFPKGSPEVPMSREELQAKFRACAHGVLTETTTERTLSYLDRLETMTSIRPLTELLRGA